MFLCVKQFLVIWLPSFYYDIYKPCTQGKQKPTKYWNTEWKWIYWPNCRKCVSFNIKQTRKQIRYMYNQPVYLYTLNEAHLSALTLHWNNLSLYNHWARWVQYNTLQYIEYNNMYQKTIPTETSKSDMNLYKKISRV